MKNSFLFRVFTMIILFGVSIVFFAGCPAEPEYQSDAESKQPNPPMDLYAELLGENSVQLSWSASDGDIGGYVIERSSGVDGFHEIGMTYSGELGFADENLAPGSYEYRVAAWASDKVSEWSNSANITIVELFLFAPPAWIQGPWTNSTFNIFWTFTSDNGSYSDDYQSFDFISFNEEWSEYEGTGYREAEATDSYYQVDSYNGGMWSAAYKFAKTSATTLNYTIENTVQETEPVGLALMTAE